MAKLVEEGERAMGIAKESEWLENVDGKEEFEIVMKENDNKMWMEKKSLR